MIELYIISGDSFDDTRPPTLGLLTPLQVYGKAS